MGERAIWQGVVKRPLLLLAGLAFALLVIVVIAAIVGIGNGDIESEQKPGEPYEAGLLDIARVELEMSHYCDGDLSLLESAARWLLVEEVSTKDWTVEDFAVFIVIIEYMCDMWRAEGNEAVAQLLFDEHDDAREAYFDQIGREKMRERVLEVQEQLEALGDLQSLRILNAIQ